MRRLLAALLVFGVLSGPVLGQVSADWDYGGGGYSGYYEPEPYDPGPSDWTPFYYGW